MQTSEAISIKTRWGEAECRAFRIQGVEHCMLIFSFGSKIPLLRLHSACLTSEVFGMQNCDCSAQLDHAMNLISSEGGILIYSQWEGRGAGLVAKFNAQNIENSLGHNTYTAYENMGLKHDLRDHDLVAQELLNLGIRHVKLLTNNPTKISALKAAGITVAREPLVLPIATEAKPYRDAQIKKGHLLDLQP